MCNFWSGIVTNDGRILWIDSVWSHAKIIKKYGLKDDKLEDREFVKVEISTNKNIYSCKPEIKDFEFMVDEEGTLPEWFRKNREELEELCWKEFRKAYQTDKLFNRDDIRDFIKSLKKINLSNPDGKPKKEWKVFYGETWNDAWNAAWNAAWDATKEASRNATVNATLDAVVNVINDAALMAGMMVVSDLDYPDKEKHEAHAKARMEIWRKGYGLLCDVNGVLYVYAKDVMQG